MTTEVVKFQDFSFTYPGSTRPALQNINLTIEEGQVVGVIGSTGAGKSTLLKALNGLVPHFTGGKQSGNVFVAGLNTRYESIPTLARHVGIVLDDPSSQIFSLTVEDDVVFGPCNLGFPPLEIRSRTEYALKSTGLEHLRDRNPNNLSGGEQQRLAIAGILAMRPRIMALDEPLSMLDPIGKMQVLSVIKEIVRKREATIIISEAGPDLPAIAELLDYAILLYDGRIIKAGQPHEIISSEELISVGIRRPQTVELFIRLKKEIPDMPIPLTVDSAVTYLNECFQFERERLRELSFIDETNEKADNSPILLARNVHFRYPTGVEALRGISLEIYPNRVVGILGQNGSGKTTLSLVLVGILKPTNPDAVIVVDGINVTRAKVRDIIMHINYVFQNPDSQLFCETVADEIAFGLRMLKLPPSAINDRVNEMLDLFELHEFRKMNPVFLPRHIRKRVAIASVYAMQPKIMIVDEPTTGLDTRETEKLMGKLLQFREHGGAIVIITHDMETAAKYCDDIIVMKQGKILLSGTARQIFSKTDILREAAILPPQITRLGQMMELKRNILSVEEFVHIIQSYGRRKWPS